MSSLLQSAIGSQGQGGQAVSMDGGLHLKSLDNPHQDTLDCLLLCSFPSPVDLQYRAGCELTGSTKSYTFKVDEEDDSDHILALSVVCLTDGAKDECNVVEVVGRNHENQEIAVPVANLRLSCQPLLSLDNFQLQPPVTFRLAAGSGPVHLAGWHQITHREDASFEEEDDMSEEEDDMSEEEIAPVMPAKKQRGKQ
ncbi:nucleoplasmin-3 isoform X1 [Apteryx mantelli]|uniref:Nucleoplasmin-3 isoform X1 n=1 Tax=Apteryx mantelli TaxID=2696672 RepID=A0ABM4ESH4_9AVES|nr:nucleoplasmin-3 isoform X2 [Apteryx rowi]